MGGNNSRHLPDYDEAVAVLGEQEVAKILEGFNRLSVRGELRPSDFRTGFLNCAGPVPEALAEALFNCFDSNSSGTLDVQQFVCGVAVICKGRPEQKLRLLFMVYDTDKHQRLSDRDLKRFAHALSDGRGSGETADAVVNSALKELLAGNSAVNYEKFETWARQHVDSPLVDWIFSLEQRVRAEDEDTTSAWRMRPPAIDRSNSVQEREELQALLDWSETLGIDKDLAKELRGAWHAVAMSSRLGVVERSALLETLPSAPAELVQRFAHAMDRAKTGTVSAREWVQDFAICLQGSLDQRKDLVFRMFADDSGRIPLAAAAELTKWGQAAVSVFSERRPNTEPRNGAGSSSGSAEALAAPRLAKQNSEQWSADSEQIAQALGYVARIDLKMVPPNAREELEIIEKLNENFNPEAPGKTGDLWYLIPARWWKQWLEFTSTGTNSREQGPPSIDNTDLVDARDFLRIGLSEGVDYEGWNRIASFPPPLFDLSSCGLPQRWVMADEDQGWYEDPLGEESINANEEPNEGRPGTDDWSDWNEQEGGSQSTSRKRKNKEELPSGLKWAKKTPPPQALSRWSSNSSWSSAGESPSTWNSWRGMSWKDKEDIDIWLQCSNLGENVPETVIVPCKTPFEGRLADSAYETGILEDHKWFGKQELLERCREQGTPLGLVIDLVNTRKYYSGFNLDDGVEYLKIQIPGREVPPRDVVEEVFNHIDDFTERRPDLYVGLHCTHGLNRTGFVVAAYLMTRRDVAHWKDAEAVAVFEKARGGKMDKAYLFEALQQLQEGKY